MESKGATSTLKCLMDIHLYRIATVCILSVLYGQFLTTPLSAQTNYPKFERLNDHFPNTETLVRSIHRDSRGYVWFGGFSHIQRYDGIEIKNYRIRDFDGGYNYGPAGLIFEDSNKNLWIFCNGQILLYDTLYDDFHYLKLEIPVEDNEVPDVTAVTEDLNKNLWIAVWNNKTSSLIKVSIKTLKDEIEINDPGIIKSDQFEVFQADPSEVDNPWIQFVEKILVDGNGDIWINRLGWIERYVQNNQSEDYSIYRYLVLVDKEGKYLDPGHRSFDVAGNNESVNLGMFLDPDKNIWATTSNRLYQFVDNNNDHEIVQDPTIQFDYFNQLLYSYDLVSRKKDPDKFIRTHDLGPDVNYYGSVQFPGKAIFWLFHRNGQKIDVYKKSSLENHQIKLEKVQEIKRDQTNPHSWKKALYMDPHLDQEGILWMHDSYSFFGLVQGEGIVTVNTKDMFPFSNIDVGIGNPNSFPSPNVFYGIRDYKDNFWFFSIVNGITVPIVANQLFNEFRQVSIANQSRGLFTYASEDLFHNMWIRSENGLRVISLPGFYADEPSVNWYYEFTPENLGVDLNETQILDIIDIILDETQTLWLYVSKINLSEDYEIDEWAILYCELGSYDKIGIEEFKDLKFKKFKFKNPEDYHHITFSDSPKYWDLDPTFMKNKTDVVYMLAPTGLLRIDPHTKDYEVFPMTVNDSTNQFTEISTAVIDDSMDDSLKVFGSYYYYTTNYEGNFMCLTFYDEENRKKLKSIRNFGNDDRFPEIPGPLLMDDHNNVWFMADNAGLFQYDHYRNKMRNFNSIYTFLNVVGIGCKVDRKGYMYFGSLSKIVVVKPNEIYADISDLRMNISEIRVKGKSIVEERDSVLIENLKMDNALILPYYKNMISFRFNLMNFSDHKRNQYKYILEGLEEEMNLADQVNNIASYSHLNPGTYTFRVLGDNGSGNWNNEGSIQLVITPPWWLTWWAYTIYVFAFIGLVFAIVRFTLVRNYLKKVVRLEQKQLQKMKHLDKMKSRFFANVSHEFRTPLTLILGPIKQMLEEEPDLENRRKLSMIARNSRKLLFLVNQLLDFAKLKSGRLSLQADEVEFVGFVKTRFAAFESLALSRNIRYKFESNAHNVKAFIDKEKLEKVLVNLISNAFKFTNEGGNIQVKVNSNGRMHKVDKGHGVIEVIVQDEGLGIDKKYVKNIFNRYYQVPDVSDSNQVGSGIGLTLVKEMVDLHHGKVTVKSKKGKGTSFKVLLPLGKEHLTKDELASPSEKLPVLIYDQTFSRPIIDENTRDKLLSDYDQDRLLIVEDNADMRIYITEILENHYLVEEAENGQEGLIKAIETVPDLIITDIMMPQMDGYEFCKKVRSDERISHIPLVILTAKAGKRNQLSGYEIGADDFITKPFTPSELRIRIQNRIDQRKKLRVRFRKDITLQPSDIAITSTDEKFLKKAMNILEKHSVNDEFGTDQFAKEIGLSRSQMHRKLKALTDQSCSEFIRSYRLNHARQLLEADFGNVAEVSYEAGFSSPSYFTECFKAQFGALPSNYTNHNTKS